MRPLTDRVVLITGASRGLGVDMAHEFARRGSRLALAARSEDELEKVRLDVEAAGAEAVAVPTDVSDAASLENLVARVEDSLGPIDVLVNNAGIERVCDFEEMPLADIERLIGVNVVGLALLTRLVVPSMIRRGEGHIVNIASMAGLMPVPHNAVYSCSKHAVVGLSRSLRLELAEHGIGVSVVCPGFVEGGMFLEWGRKPPSAAGWVTPKQVAQATVRAVLDNRAEAKVIAALGKIGPVLQALSPSFSGRAMGTSGVVGYLREQARLNAEGRPGG